ncbi:MAG TPA: tetratricopeptide repeat protein [Gemmatimonadales bacterium]
MTVTRTAAALLTLSFTAASAGAQGATCDIKSSGSAQVTSAYEALNNFASGEPTAAAGKQLAKAVGLVTAKADRPGADDARQWVLAQSLAAFTLIPNQPTQGARADFGFTDRPQEQVDIVIVADSALDVVEKAHPGCKAQIDPLRNMILIAAINEATAKFNGGDAAGAKALAERVLVVEPTSPHAHHLLANVAVKEQQYPAAVELFEKVADQTKGDSTMAELYSTSVQSAAYILNSLAENATGEEQAQFGRRAAARFQEYLAINPADAQAKQALGKAQAISGDTAAATALYGEMIANPGKYNSFELVNAGVGAANAGRPADAVRLVEAGLQSNPYLRDALYILATVAVQAEQYDKVNPTVDRLLKLDPNNPDNYALLAAGYQGLLSETTDKKLQKAYTDSMMRATLIAQQMPVRVSINEFAQQAENQHVLNGAVENLGDAEASYTLKFEFLDASGNPVATREQVIDAVAPKSSKTFSIAIEQPGVAAYRYAPIWTPSEKK